MTSHTAKRPLKWGLMILLLLIGSFLKAQNKDITGTVTDSIGKPLWKATVTMVPLDFGKVKRTMTDSQGQFKISNNGSKNYKIVFTNIGYKPDTLDSDFIYDENVIIKLSQQTFMLHEVIVLSHPKVPIMASKDTISYDLASFAGKDDKYLYETLARIKGLRISQNGQVVAQGEQITKIMLNDEEIFNGNVGLLTRNLPLEILETAEIINDYGKESSITGIKTKPTKILNIHTKNPNVIGGFGELMAGGGSKKTYILNGSANYFDQTNQISASAGINNINKPNVLSSSIIDNTGNSSIGIEGLNKATNYAINARTKFGENSSIYVSADQSSTTNKTYGQAKNTSILQSDNIDYTEDFNRSTENLARNFNARYDLNSQKIALNISPWLRTQKQDLADKRNTVFESMSDSSRTYSLQGESDRDEFGIESSLTYKFNKAKRAAGFRLTADKSNINENKSIFNDFNTSFEPLNLNVQDKNTRKRFNPSLFYNEPLGKNAIIQLSYSRNQTDETLNRNTIDQDGQQVDSLMGNITSSFIKNHFDARLQFTKNKFLFDLLASYQNDYLSSRNQNLDENTKIEFNNFAPSAQVTYVLNNEEDLTISAKRYRTLPGINQVITIPTLTDPLFVYTGNSNIQPETNTQLNLGYKSTNVKTGKVFRANIDYTIIDDKIISNSAQVIKDKAQQFVTLSNADGFKRFSADYFYSKNIGNNKLLDIVGRISHDNNPQYIDNDLYYGTNFNIHQSVKLFWPVTNYLNLIPSVMYRLSDIEYGLSEVEISPINTFNLILDAAVNKGDFSFKIGANKFINSGFSGNSYNNFIINSSISYKAAKGACVINLEAVDLLNNNTGIRRNAYNNNITDMYVNRLSRYFMLSVHYKIGNFK